MKSTTAARPSHTRRHPSSRLGVAALVLALALAGCSAIGLAYNQANVLVYWWLDDLVGFDRSQAQAVKGGLEEVLAWHRRQQLPVWAADLERLSVEVTRDATGEQACNWYQRLLTHRDAVLTQAAPLIAPVAASLTPAQLLHLERRFRDRDEKWRKEHLQADSAKREEEQLERTVERLERLYGSLPREQRQWLGDQLRGSPWDPQRWLAERQAHQRLTIDSLRQLRGKAPVAPTTGSNEDALSGTRRWLLRLTQPSSETVRAEMDRLVRHQCSLTADFHNRTTPQQRQHAAERLADWAREARRLAKSGADQAP